MDIGDFGTGELNEYIEKTSHAWVPDALKRQLKDPIKEIPEISPKKRQGGKGIPIAIS